MASPVASIVFKMDWKAYPGRGDKDPMTMSRRKSKNLAATESRVNRASNRVTESHVHHTKLAYVHRCKVGDELPYGILGASDSLSPFSFHQLSQLHMKFHYRLATIVISKNNSCIFIYLINRWFTVFLHRTFDTGKLGNFWPFHASCKYGNGLMALVIHELFLGRTHCWLMRVSNWGPCQIGKRKIKAQANLIHNRWLRKWARGPTAQTKPTAMLNWFCT